MNVINTGLALLLTAVIAPSFAAEKAEIPAQATAKVNAQFEVKLPSSPTTGYNWIVRQLPEQVALTGMDYTQRPDCGGMLGCDGTTTLYFKAVKAGTGKLVVQYARPWETLTNEAATINIHVTP